MLHKFVSRNRQLIESLAQSWQKAGVRGFALLDSRGNAVFGDGATAGQQLTMPLGQYGALQITVGSPEPGAVNGYEMQLACQAQLLTQILKREAELESMTVELMGAYDQLVAMYNLSQATRAHLDLESLLGSLLQETVNLTEAERGFVALQDDQGWKKLASVPTSPHPDDLIPSLSQVVRERGRPLVCNSPEECRRILPSLPSRVERLSLTPVKVGGEVVAVIGLFNRPEAFTAGNQKLVGALAEEAGSIIERAQLQQQMVTQERMQRELEIAASIQMSLLPTALPQIEGLDIAASCRPANEVGGDFFDFVRNEDGLLGVTLGDVASKGVPAALFMVVSRTLLRTAASLYVSPSRVLEHVNQEIYEDLSNVGLFVTAFFAYYDPLTGVLTYANAGHAPVIFYRKATASSEFWEADGPPIGVLPQVTSRDYGVPLMPGDVLVIMSDGFNEATNGQGEMFGIQRLQEVLSVNATQSAERICAALFSAVETFAEGTPQADDQTVVVLKVVGQMIRGEDRWTPDVWS